ncbi:unnamed protein product [Linum trigynum]|uniref:Uncharacterized protein n=1 Tax=Linum trigynum TaxID=586398 RepID=A0AAV2GBZ5_9ROSI
MACPALISPIRPLSYLSWSAIYYHHHPLPSVPYKVRNYRSEFRMDIAGCCDDIFCIFDMNHIGIGNIILWNPVMSEIKYLSLSPCPHHLSLEAYDRVDGQRIEFHLVWLNTVEES